MERGRGRKEELRVGPELAMLGSSNLRRIYVPDFPLLLMVQHVSTLTLPAGHDQKG